MLRFLPVAVELVLLVWCLIEAIQAPADSVRNLDKTLWIILIILIPIVGPVAWLVAGRPVTPRRTTWAIGNGFPESSRPRRQAAPDDDPAFLASLPNEREKRLEQWEAELRAREERLRRDDPEPPAPGSTST